LGADPPRAASDRPVSADDDTFRPTVMIRRGPAQGSGTVIASIEGETLILTAAHAVQEPGELLVELHRYNLGLEGRDVPGPLPWRLHAELAVSDVDADVAIVRIRGAPALPYVARLGVGAADPPPGTVVP